MLFSIQNFAKSTCAVLGTGLLLGWLISGCNTIDQPVTPLPEDTATSLGRIAVEGDTSGITRIPLKMLKIDLAKAFTFSARDFKHGAFDVEGNSALVYKVTGNQNWAADSGTVQVCQGGKCREGQLKITSKRFIPVVDTTQPTPVADMLPVVIPTFDGKDFVNLNGMEETGAVVDSIWGFFYTAQIQNGGMKITYFSAGGLANGLNLGTDQIYYRVKRPNGRNFKGMIPIILDDSCKVRAKSDLIGGVTNAGFIPHSSVLTNDIGCGSAVPANPVNLRLELRPYVGKKKVNTQFGEIRDTTDNGGNPAFFYRRLLPGSQADTTFYFLQEGDLQRLTRGKLIIQN